MRLKSPTYTAVHVALTNGHAINIGPEGREVPAMFVQAAFSNGAIPDSSDGTEFIVEPQLPTDASQLELLVAGIKKMLTEQPDKFTGAGLPNRNILSGVVGWNVSVQEVSEAMRIVTEEAAQ